MRNQSPGRPARRPSGSPGTARPSPRIRPRIRPRPRGATGLALLATTLVVAVSALMVTSCGSRLRSTAVALHPNGQRPAATPPTDPANPGSIRRTPVDVSRVLVAPRGFEALRPDQLSGPVDGPADLLPVLPDAGMDPAPLVAGGFVAGYIRVWRASQVASDPSGQRLPPTTLMTAAVLRFRTPADAEAALGLIRQHGRVSGEQEFGVPAQLPSGYGSYRKVASTAPGYRYGVLWVRGTDLLDLAVTYPQPASATQVVSLATAQDGALGG